VTYTGLRCDSCNALMGKPHAAWCTAKLDAYAHPLPGSRSVPSLVTFTVLEKD
jgi:hypothetical protein